MKALVGSFALVSLLCACQRFEVKAPAGNAASSNTKVAGRSANESEAQRKVEPLMDFTGFWSLQNGEYRNTIKIESEVDFTTKTLRTKVFGLDLEPQFKYISSALAEDDNPYLELNGARVEALLMKTLGGQKRIVEFVFELQDTDTLKVSVRGNGKSYSEIYKRVTNEVRGGKEFYSLAVARAEKILATEIRTYNESLCSGHWAYPVSELAERYQNACLMKRIESGGLSPNDAEVFRAAIKSLNVDLLKQLIARGLKVDEFSFTDILLKTTGYIFKSSALTVGEHGGVRYATNLDETLRLLLANSSKSFVATDVLQGVLRSTSDAGLIHQLLDRKGDGPTINELTLLSFVNHYTRWEKEGPKLFERLLRMFPADGFSKLESSLLEEWSIQYLDAEALQILASHGFTFEHSKFNGSTSEKWIADAENDANDPKLRPYEEIKAASVKLQKVRANLEWVRQQSPR